MALISLVEWANRNGMAPVTARQRAERGTLPAIKIGRNWVIEEDVEKIDHRTEGLTNRWPKNKKQ